MINQNVYRYGATRSRIRDLFEYGLRQAAIVGKENVFDFSLGNPSIPAPEKVAQTIRKLLEGDPLAIHGYTPAAGAMEARQAVARDLCRRTGKAIRPENIFFTCGAAPALTSCLLALAVENSEVLILAPYFPEYKAYAHNAHMKVVEVPADTEAFQVRIDEVEKRISSHTQALIINSPNNPSGVIYSVETLTALAELLRRKSEEYGHPIYIIADEPYRELTYDGAETPYIPGIYDDTLVCYSWSKSLSMPGERIGYVLVPDSCADSEILFAAIAGAARTLGHVCAPSLLQRVVAECVELRPDLRAYDENRMTLYNALTEMGFSCVKPTGAFYMLVRSPSGDGEEFCARAKEKNVLIVPTDSFGCPGFCRVSTCVSPEMIRRSLPIFREVAQSYGLSK